MKPEFVEKTIESLSQRRELNEAAKALLADKAFGYAVCEMQRRWYGQLVALPHDGPAQAEMAARLRALEALPNELGRLISDYREARRA